MKWLIVLFVFVANFIAGQAQELPKDWHKKADTAYVEKDYFVGIAKGKSINLAMSKKIALFDAKGEVKKILKDKTMSISYEEIDTKTFKDGNFYIYYVAIKVKKK